MQVPAIKAIPDRKNNALTRCTVLHAISALTCVPIVAHKAEASARPAYNVSLALSWVVVPCACVGA